MKTLRHPVAYISLLAVLLALANSLFIYPRIAGKIESSIANDGYDQLAFGLYHEGTLSYYPSTSPTVMRGPIYPAFLETLLHIDEHSWPYSVQFMQALLHGLTCLLVFAITIRLCGTKCASFASLVCAAHPLLLFYTSRIVTESLSTFLFTLMVFLLLYFAHKPSILKAIVVGLSIGIGSLCKQTFLPFVVLVPLFVAVCEMPGKRLRHALIILLASAALILPWTARNYRLTGEIVVVHTLAGYNFAVCDAQVDYWLESPFGYEKLGTLVPEPVVKDRNGDGITQGSLQSLTALEDIEVERDLMERSVKKYLDDPTFLVRKVVYNAIRFWTMASKPSISSLFALMQLPLLLAVIFSAIALVRREGLLAVPCVPLYLAFLYFIFHLPIYALARFSVVLIPTMTAYGAFWLWSRIGKIRR